MKMKKYGLPMLLTQDEGVKSFIANLTAQLSGKVLPFKKHFLFCLDIKKNFLRRKIKKKKESGKFIGSRTVSRLYWGQFLSFTAL